jgi:hypothetical protein
MHERLMANLQPDLLDEDVVTLIRKLPVEEQIGVAGGEVVRQFLQRHGSLEESDIPAAVKAFETLLREAFQEAKKGQQGQEDDSVDTEVDMN